MNYTELKEKVDQYIETLPTGTWSDLQDQKLAAAALNGFLWWLYPQMKDEDLPDYEDVSQESAELYRIQHSERCPQVDSDGPPEGHIPCPHPRHPLEEEPVCSLCMDAGVILDIFEGWHDCPRCG